MYGTHALYARSIIYEDDEWKLQTYGDGMPMLAYVTVEADGAVTFGMSDKLYCQFHDEAEYQWRAITPEVARRVDEATARVKAACDEYEAEWAARMELPY